LRAVLGLGSNLGDRWSFLADAVAVLRGEDPDALVSSVYETEPVGGPDDQGAFLNCVVVLETDRSPMALLELAHELERAANRVRLVRFGPRTLDVDVLDYADVRSDDPLLTLPHPRMFERAFVLVPLNEVAPDLVPKDWLEHLGGEGHVAQAVRRVGALLAPISKEADR
jgi:2-amino-4-hydroxy-6-hydroxymethyldihydropteridine diphosphokinase